MTAGRRIDTSSVDWAEVRSRIDAARRAYFAEERMSRDRAHAILAERARELARPSAEKRMADDLEVMTFTLAGERYGLEVRAVVEVFRLADLARLPGAEAPVVGIVGWRGRILTILDLRSLLGLPSSSLEGLGRVIVLREDRPAFGILAGTVDDVVTLSAGEVRAPQDGVAANRRYVRGVAGDGLLVLDAQALARVGEPAH